MNKIKLEVNKIYEFNEIVIRIADVLKFHVHLYYHGYSKAHEIAMIYFEYDDSSPYEYKITEKDKEELEKQVAIYILQK